MSAYVARLKAAQERAEQRQAAADRVQMDAARERMTPLEDRLARLLATIPIEVQQEGLSLPALQASLRGRWRGKVHPGELGAALRRAGFVRKRQWKSSDSFSTIWRRL